MEKTGIRKFDYFRTYYFEGATKVGPYGFPKIKGTQSIPRNVISISEVSGYRKDRNCRWVDHYVDDEKFVYAWNNLDSRISLYKQFEGVIGFDHSLDCSFQLGQNIWNCTKNRNADYYLQQHGIDVIPSVSWCDKSSFEWCLYGLPKYSSLAVSSNGCLSNDDSLEMFLYGINVIQNRLEPSHLIVCGRAMDELSSYSNIYYYPCFSTRMKERRKLNGR